MSYEVEIGLFDSVMAVMVAASQGQYQEIVASSGEMLPCVPIQTHSKEANRIRTLDSYMLTDIISAQLILLILWVLVNLKVMKSWMKLQSIMS